MEPISQTVVPFLGALKAGEPITITPEGNWYKKGLLSRVISAVRTFFSNAFSGCFFGSVFAYDANYENAKNLISSLSTPRIVSSEQIRGISRPKGWNPEHLHNVVQAVKETLQSKVKKEEEKIAALTVQRQALQASNQALGPHTPIVELNRKIFGPEGWIYRSASANLDRLYLMHQYLGTDQQIIDSTSVNLEDCAWLEKELESWQEQQFPYVPYVSGKNHILIQEKIRHCCRYTEFIAAARNNRCLLDMCFLSVFKSMPDGCINAIDVFLQAPHIQEALRKTFLDKRVRDITNNGVRFVQHSADGSPEKTPIKDVQLLIDSEYQSICDENASVRVAKNVTQTVSQVFQEFEAQNFRFIVTEYLQDTGVTPFDGRLLNFDFSKKEWWKELPVIRRMTRREVEEAFNTSFAEDSYALFALRASRTTPDLNGDGNHGWADLAIPLSDGTFNVLSLGKFSDWFPVNVGQSFYHIFRTHRAYVTILDTNSFMSSRDRTAVALPPLTRDHFDNFMEILKGDFLRSRNGELTFQAQGDNCAAWILSLVRRNWPELDIEPYATRFQDLRLPDAFMPLIWSQNLFPNEPIWQWFRRGFCSLFGATSAHYASDGQGGTTPIRLIDNKDWYEGRLQLPSRLWLEKDRLFARIQDFMKEQREKQELQKQPAEAIAV